MKTKYALLLLVFASNEDQRDYARNQVIPILLKKKLVKRVNDYDVTLTDKAIKGLKKYFDIRFEYEEPLCEVVE